MSAIINRCIIGEFDITDAFSAVDEIEESSYLAASAVQWKDKWLVEILSENPIKETELRSVFIDKPFKVLENAPLKEENWLQKCLENLKPLVIGSFYVYGPHLKNKPRPANKIAIEIAAATAFGSGSHATTNRCLAACEAFFDSKKHKKILDLGCGSGILSIALAKLGAKNIFAYDNDDEAVRVTKENTVINKVSPYISAFQNDGTSFENDNYDLIVSNILAEPLISMSKEIFNSLNPGGLLILSGFSSDDNSVQDKFLSFGLKLIHRYDQNDWTTIVLDKDH